MRIRPGYRFVVHFKWWMLKCPIVAYGYSADEIKRRWAHLRGVSHITQHEAAEIAEP